MNVVVDTSAVIHFLRTKDLESLYIEVRRNHDVILSLITVAELYVGKSVQEEGKELDTLKEIIGGATIEIPDLEIAEKAGKLRALYQLSLADAFIATLALTLNLPLVTLDRKAFERIKGLEFYIPTR